MELVLFKKRRVVVLFRVLKESRSPRADTMTVVAPVVGVVGIDVGFVPLAAAGVVDIYFVVVFTRMALFSPLKGIHSIQTIMSQYY